MENSFFDAVPVSAPHGFRTDRAKPRSAVHTVSALGFCEKHSRDIPFQISPNVLDYLLLFSGPSVQVGYSVGVKRLGRDRISLPMLRVMARSIPEKIHW